MNDIPQSHPRYQSLVTRQQIAEAMKTGVVHETGLIAHGRGEAFDYLLGEQTIPEAESAAKVAAAVLLSARNPVISVNGNVVALVAKDCIQLAELIPAKLEVNLFHRTPERVRRLVELLRSNGAPHVYGEDAEQLIPGLDHDRTFCSRDGIFTADTVLVCLEDGDRCHALLEMGKTVIAVDLNPLSRTARSASVTIVDNVTRALPRIIYGVEALRAWSPEKRERLRQQWDNTKNLHQILVFLSKRLKALE